MVRKYKNERFLLRQKFLNFYFAFTAVTSQLVNFPLMINDKTEEADFENFVQIDEKAQRFHNILYTNERVRKVIKVMLPRFDNMGLLDVAE